MDKKKSKKQQSFLNESTSKPESKALHLLDSHHHVDPPVGLHRPAVPLAVSDLLQEVLLGHGLALPLLQRLPQVVDVLGSAELRDASQQHEGEERDEQVGVGAKGEVGLAAGVLVGSGQGGTGQGGGE